MKQYILLLVLMVMGAGIHAYAEDVNPGSAEISGW